MRLQSIYYHLPNERPSMRARQSRPYRGTTWRLDRQLVYLVVPQHGLTPDPAPQQAEDKPDRADHDHRSGSWRLKHSLAFRGAGAKPIDLLRAEPDAGRGAEPVGKAAEQIY
jgi:hypothetical protein